MVATRTREQRGPDGVGNVILQGIDDEAALEGSPAWAWEIGPRSGSECVFPSVRAHLLADDGHVAQFEASGAPGVIGGEAAACQAATVSSKYCRTSSSASLSFVVRSVRLRRP